MLLIWLHKKFSLINARHIVCFLIELYTAQGISDDVYCQWGSYVTGIANSWQNQPMNSLPVSPHLWLCATMHITTVWQLFCFGARGRRNQGAPILSRFTFVSFSAVMLLVGWHEENQVHENLCHLYPTVFPEQEGKCLLEWRWRRWWWRQIIKGKGSLFV